MLRCPHCGTPRRADAAPCPYCTHTPRAPGWIFAAATLALSACQEMYGIVVTDKPGPPDTAGQQDADADGWVAGEDCDDDDATIHPEATETPGDGVDSNCDNSDDT